MKKVSIVIPTRNRYELLARSLEYAHKQNYQNLEIIISNNNSSDKTFETLNELKIQYPNLIIVNHKETLPLGEHWDTVINKYSTGEYILLIPDDDVLTDENYIHDVVNLFQKYNSIGIVFAKYTAVDSKDIELFKYETIWNEFL